MFWNGYDLLSRHLLDVSAQIVVGPKEDSVTIERSHNIHRICGGAAYIGKNLRLCQRVDIQNQGHTGVSLLPAFDDRSWEHLCHRTSGLRIGDHDLLFWI